jgi:hypothetical protein
MDARGTCASAGRTTRLGYTWQRDRKHVSLRDKCQGMLRALKVARCACNAQRSGRLARARGAESNCRRMKREGSE